MAPSYNFDKLFFICRNFNESDSLDPIDYECIDKIDTWVVDNESPREPKLNLEKLENMVAQAEEERQEQGEGGQNEGVQNISGKYYAISMITR